MLGRYIAGTCLILGVAMVITPDTRERPEPQVTRAQIPSPSQRDAEPIPVSLSVQQPAATTSAPALAAPVERGLVADENVLTAALQEALKGAPSDGDGEIGGIAELAGLAPDPGVSAEPIAEAGRSETDLNLVMFVSGSRVNVRSGPSTQYGVINSVQYGDAVELVGYEADGWARIRIGGTEEVGYMAHRFLTETLNGG